MDISSLSDYNVRRAYILFYGRMRFSQTKKGKDRHNFFTSLYSLHTPIMFLSLGIWVSKREFPFVMLDSCSSDPSFHLAFTIIRIFLLFLSRTFFSQVFLFIHFLDPVFWSVLFSLSMTLLSSASSSSSQQELLRNSVWIVCIALPLKLSVVRVDNKILPSQSNDGIFYLYPLCQHSTDWRGLSQNM